MQGKHIVFLADVMSPVFGSFNAGDVAKNVDAAFAQSMVDAKTAKFTDASTAQADSDAAADAAGRLTKRTQAEPAQVARQFFSAKDGLPKADSTTPNASATVAPAVAGSIAQVDVKEGGPAVATLAAPAGKVKTPAPVPPGRARSAPKAAAAAKGAKTVASAKKAGGGKSAAGKAAGKSGAKAK